jgi:uncharacterized protein (DUF58 family)
MNADLMRKVRRIEIKTRRRVTETLAGSYHSAFRGHGMEFAETREYRPGDDIRAIDWNVTSRASRPDRPLYVKLFTEERELSVIVLADVSGSAATGSRDRLKSEVMAELTALIAFAAIVNRDRVGLVRYSDRLEQYLPPKSGTTHALRVVREILTPPAVRRRTDLAGALQFLLRVQRRPCVVFVISDLIAPDFERPLRLVTRRHDVVALELFDPIERALPRAGLVWLEDAETGARRLVDSSARAVRQRLAEAAAQRQEATRSLLRRAGADWLALDISRDYDKPLLRFFQDRAARVRA